MSVRLGVVILLRGIHLLLRRRVEKLLLGQWLRYEYRLLLAELRLLLLLLSDLLLLTLQLRLWLLR